MPRPKFVEIEKDGSKAQVAEQSLSVWKRNGWTVVEDGSSENSKETPEKETKEKKPTDVNQYELFTETKE
jgi:hypothetical protein